MACTEGIPGQGSRRQGAGQHVHAAQPAVVRAKLEAQGMHCPWTTPTQQLHCPVAPPAAQPTLASPMSSSRCSAASTACLSAGAIWSPPSACQRRRRQQRGASTGGRRRSGEGHGSGHGRRRRGRCCRPVLPNNELNQLCFAALSTNVLCSPVPSILASTKSTSSAAERVSAGCAGAAGSAVRGTRRADRRFCGSGRAPPNRACCPGALPLSEEEGRSCAAPSDILEAPLRSQPPMCDAETVCKPRSPMMARYWLSRHSSTNFAAGCIPKRNVVDDGNHRAPRQAPRGCTRGGRRPSLRCADAQGASAAPARPGSSSRSVE